MEPSLKTNDDDTQARAKETQTLSGGRRLIVRAQGHFHERVVERHSLEQLRSGSFPPSGF